MVDRKEKSAEKKKSVDEHYETNDSRPCESSDDKSTDKAKKASSERMEYVPSARDLEVYAALYRYEADGGAVEKIGLDSAEAFGSNSKIGIELNGIAGDGFGSIP